jgi:5-methylcytosine-specific restriction endonuclease McrA
MSPAKKYYIPHPAHERQCQWCGRSMIGTIRRAWCGYACQKAAQRAGKSATGSTPPSQRFTIFQRDGFRCVYCGLGVADGAVLELDHRDPNGPGNASNLVTACRTCNVGKGNRSL